MSSRAQGARVPRSAADQPPPAAEPSGERNAVILGPRDRLIGTLHIEGDLWLGGIVEGGVDATGDVEIGDEAKVNASVAGRDVSIHGHVSGPVTARKRLMVARSASLTGDVRVARLVIQDGASFSGNVSMGPASEVASKLTQPATKLPEPAPSPPAPQAPSVQDGDGALADGNLKPAEVKVTPPEAKAAPPEVKAKPTQVVPRAAEVKVKPPEVKAKPIEVVARAPEVKVKPPEVKAKAPEVKAKAPEVKAKAPEMKAKAPDVKAKTPQGKGKAKR